MCVQTLTYKAMKVQSKEQQGLLQASKEPRATAAQHTPSSTRHSLTEAVHIMQSQVLVAGSINSPRQNRQLSQEQKR